eukprot:753522-Hanusia_phi.AAC.1
MATYLGVDWTKEFYLLPIVRKAIVAPFPVDWEISKDRYGKVYYHNKLTYKGCRGSAKKPSERAECNGGRGMKTSMQLPSDPSLRKRQTSRQSRSKAVPGCGSQPLTRTRHSGSTLRPKLFTLMPKATNKIEKERKKNDSSKVVQKMQKELKFKKALQMALSSGLRAFWLKWQVHIMELRNKQATALLKAGLIEGRQEAKGFRQWKEKSEQLAFVRRALAPLGGRRDKAIWRDAFRAWHEVIHAEVEEKEKREWMLLIFSSWKEKSKTTSHFNNVKKIIQSMLSGNSIAMNFGEWQELARESKSIRMKIMSDACIKIQRQYRERRAKKSAEKDSVNLRKQMKYRLLRIGNTVEGESPAKSEDNVNENSDDEGEGGSLLLHLLEGAMQKTEEAKEKVRLEKIAREARTKSSLEPTEEGFGIGSVKNDINRIAELLDPPGRDEFLHNNHGVAAAGSYKTLNDSINTLFEKIVNVQSSNNSIMQEIAADLLDSREGGNIAKVAAQTKQHLDKGIFNNLATPLKSLFRWLRIRRKRLRGNLERINQVRT